MDGLQFIRIKKAEYDEEDRISQITEGKQVYYPTTGSIVNAKLVIGPFDHTLNDLAIIPLK